MAAAATTLENAAVTVRFDPATPGRIAELHLRSGARTLPGFAFEEFLVCDEGTHVPLPDFSPVDGIDPHRVADETMLPPNPLRGRQPPGGSDLEWYSQDDTSTLRLRRTVELPDPEAATLRIVYRVDNTGADAARFCLALGQSTGRNSALFRPTFEGVQRLMPETGQPAAEYDAPASWTARLQSGTITVARYDRRITSCLRGNGIVTTWQELAPGATWSTTVDLDFLVGTATVTGAGPGLALGLALPEPPQVAAPKPDGEQIDDMLETMAMRTLRAPRVPVDGPDPHPRRAFMPDTPLTVTVHSAGTKAARALLHVTARHLPTGSIVDLGRHAFAVAPGTPDVRPIVFTPTHAGTWVLQAACTTDDGRIATASTPVIIDQPAGIWLPGREVPAVALDGREFDRFRKERYRNPAAFDALSGDQPLTTAVALPHVTFANPLHGGPLRVACFIPFWRAREAVEMMLRMDIDMRPVLVGTHGIIMTAIEKLQAGRPLTAAVEPPAFEVRQMKRVLAQPSEVILVAGVRWRWFPEDVRAEMIHQVRTGSVLVLYPPAMLDGEMEALIGKERLDRLDQQSPQSVDLDKGRIVLFNGAPSVAFAQAIFTNFFRDSCGPGLETLCRTMLHAARPARPVALSWTAPTNDASPTIRVHVAETQGHAFAGTLELVARTPLDNFGRTYGRSMYAASPFPYYEESASVRQAVSLAGGGQEAIELTLPLLPGGRQHIVAILRDAAGATVDWLSAPITVRPAIAVHKVQLEPSDGHGRAGRTTRHSRLQAVIEFGSQDQPPPEGTLTAFLRGSDASGRLVFAESAPVVLAGASATVTLETSLVRALHRFLVIHAGVEHDGRVMAEQRLPLVVAREPERDTEWEYILLGKEGYFPHHLYAMTAKSAGLGEFWPHLDMRYEPWPNIISGAGGRENPVEEAERVAREAMEAGRQQILERLAVPDPLAGQAAPDISGALGLDDDAATVRAPLKRTPQPAFVRPICHNDPAVFAGALKRTLDAVKAANAGWPVNVMVVDEYGYGNPNACGCEHCVKAFPEYLKKHFVTLERLNREWGTSLTRWEDAELFTISKDFDLPERAQRARLVTTLRWRAWQMVNLARRVADAVREVYPDADFGFSGMGKMSLWNGYDFQQMAKIGRAHKVYRDDWYWRGFAGRGGVRGWYHGYGSHYSPAQQAARPWSYLERDLGGTGAWIEYGYPFARPDGILHEGPRRFFENMEEIRRGSADLLLGRLVDDPVGLVWSEPSFIVYGTEWWEGTKARGTFYYDGSFGAGRVFDWMRRSTGTIRSAIETSRLLSPTAIGYGAVGDGSFGPGGIRPKLLFLPYTVAMSEDEARNLREFVATGGILVGDVNTATHSEFGHTLATPLLDDVFGVRRTGPFQLPIMLETGAEPSTAATLTLPGQETTLHLNPLVVGAPNLAPVTAEAHGRWGTPELGGPLFLVNRFGKGLAITLNWIPLTANEITGATQASATTPAQTAAIAWILDHVPGLSPFAWVEEQTATGTIRRSGCARYRDGANDYALASIPAGFPPTRDRALRQSLVLREPRHVTDLRRGRYIGFTDRIELDWDGTRHAALFALLPYRVTALAVDAPVSVEAGTVASIPVRVRAAEDAAPGRHVIRVDASKPDGTPEAILGYNAQAPDGRCTVEIPLALNAEPGRWIVRLRDVASGVEHAFPLTVTARTTVMGR